MVRYGGRHLLGPEAGLYEAVGREGQEEEVVSCVVLGRRWRWLEV